jgi:hypothetical protein
LREERPMVRIGARLHFLSAWMPPKCHSDVPCWVLTREQDREKLLMELPGRMKLRSQQKGEGPEAHRTGKVRDG